VRPSGTFEAIQGALNPPPRRGLGVPEGRTLRPLGSWGLRYSECSSMEQLPDELLAKARRLVNNAAVGGIVEGRNMTSCVQIWRILALAAAVLVMPVGYAEDFRPEPLRQIESLPATYPDHWLVVHDATFFHMREGRFLFVDPAADTVGGQLRGMLSADFMAHYEQSSARGEHYVIESFFSRGGRGGERTDVVSIYDAASLDLAGEIIIPPKKISSMPQRFGTALVADDRLLVVYNFTPRQSITVVDLEKREFVAEYEILGCALVFPTGESGVTSLCSDGSLLTTVLTAEGEVAASHRTGKIINMDDPMFEKAAIIDGLAYFPTFHGSVVPVDLSGETAEAGEVWSLVSDGERAAGWRPGGWQLVASDANGRFYILMHPDGEEGSHKNGGGEVWVFDVADQQRTARIELPNWGVSIGVNSAANPSLVVTNGNLALEVYDAESGILAKTLAVQTQTAFVIRGVR